MMGLPEGFELDAPVGPPGDDEVGRYIVDAARKRGIPAEDALSVWAGEGKGAWQSNFVKNGKREESYGPYQLYKGGGLGNAFQRDTGLDPADPTTWKQGVDYALDTAAKEGWGQWYGAPGRLRSRGGYTNPAGGTDVPMGAQGAGLPEGFELDAPETSPVVATGQTGAQAGNEAAPAEGNAYVPTPWSEIDDDATSGAISGSVGGLIGLAGLPGDLAKGLDYAHDQLGLDKSPIGLPMGVKAIGQWLRDNATSEDISNIETPFGRLGDAAEYTPKTGAGEIAQTATGLLPMLMGSGASATRQGANLLGTTLAAETGEQLGGPLGGAAAAVVASHGLSKGSVPKQPATTLTDEAKAAETGLHPVTEAIHRKAGESYKAADDANVAINGPSVAAFQRRLQADKELKKLDFDPKEFPSLAKLKDQLQTNPVWGKSHLTFTELEELRHKATLATQSAKGKERFMAGRIVEHIDDYFDNLKPGDYTGDYNTAKAAIDDARTNWRTYRKAEKIDTIVNAAKERAGQFSVSGDENAIRTGFRQLATKIARDPRERRLWTRDERKIIQQLSRGEGLRNKLRGVGAVLNSRYAQSLGLLGGAGASYAAEDPTYAIWSALGLVAGHGARGIAGKMAKGKANKLGTLVRGGGNMQNAMPLSPRAAGLLSLNQYLGQ